MEHLSTSVSEGFPLSFLLPDTDSGPPTWSWVLGTRRAGRLPRTGPLQVVLASTVLITAAFCHPHLLPQMISPSDQTPWVPLGGIKRRNCVWFTA